MATFTPDDVVDIIMGIGTPVDALPPQEQMRIIKEAFLRCSSQLQSLSRPFRNYVNPANPLTVPYDFDTERKCLKLCNLGPKGSSEELLISVITTGFLAWRLSNETGEHTVSRLDEEELKAYLQQEPNLCLQILRSISSIVGTAILKTRKELDSLSSAKATIDGFERGLRSS